MFVCAAVIGQTSQPLYLETFQPEQAVTGDALTFHYLVHCALDGVEEKLTATRKAPQQAGDSFLGLLYSTEDYHVYGYLTNTRIKLITVTGDEAAKEEDVRAVLCNIHTAYVDAISNPFHDAGQPLTSARFHQRVRAIMDRANAVA